MTELPRIAHPGPAASHRWVAAPTGAEPVEVELCAGIPLDRAICDAVGDRAGAWLTFGGAQVETLSYVIPAGSDGTHAAWYSETLSFEPGLISNAGVFLGRHGTAPFLHCHGLWRGSAETPERMGHLLCDRTILAQPVMAKGWLFRDAGFAREPDDETKFDLFTPRSIHPGPAQGLLVRLRPNVEIGAALAEICAAWGLQAARIHGIGSLIGARFADGGTLDSYATEFLIRDGSFGNGQTRLDIVIVGMDGSHRAGLLARDANAVCVTAEIFIEVVR